MTIVIASASSLFLVVVIRELVFVCLSLDQRQQTMGSNCARTIDVTQMTLSVGPQQQRPESPTITPPYVIALELLTSHT